MRICNKCNQEKELEKFGLDKRKPEGRNTICKACINLANRLRYLNQPREQREYLQQWRKDNKDSIRFKDILIRYRLSSDEYYQLLQYQENCCAICGTSDPGGKGSWHIDHDHVTQKVRGLLCHQCNVGLGMFKDNTEVLAKAIEYLNSQNNVRSVASVVLSTRRTVLNDNT